MFSNFSVFAIFGVIRRKLLSVFITFSYLSALVVFWGDVFWRTFVPIVNVIVSVTAVVALDVFRFSVETFVLLFL